MRASLPLVIALAAALAGCASGSVKPKDIGRQHPQDALVGATFGGGGGGATPGDAGGPPDGGDGGDAGDAGDAGPGDGPDGLDTDAARAPQPPTASPSGAPVGADCTGGHWQIEALGQARDVLVIVPPGLGQGAPAVVALHGNGDTADNFCQSTSICDYAADRGALVLVPQGRSRQISAFGQTIPADWDAYNQPPDANEDVALYDALVAEADRRCGVGDVYVFGHSQGGYLAFTLAMSRADRIDGAAISAAADSLPGYAWAPARAIPMYLLIGERDPAADAAQQTAARLRQAGHRVQLEVLPGVGHGGYVSGHEPAIWAFLTSP